MSKTIPLTQGKVAIVDDGDYPLVSQFKWYAVKISNKWYAATGNKARYLHRVIIGENEKEKDHIDGNGLNCQRDNLRECTHKQNMANRKVRADSSTGIRGVVLSNRKKHPYAVFVNGKRIGQYKTIGEADRAAQAKRKEVFGEFA